MIKKIVLVSMMLFSFQVVAMDDKQQNIELYEKLRQKYIQASLKDIQAILDTIHTFKPLEKKECLSALTYLAYDHNHFGFSRFLQKLCFYCMQADFSYKSGTKIVLTACCRRTICTACIKKLECCTYCKKVIKVAW